MRIVKYLCFCLCLMVLLPVLAQAEKPKRTVLYLNSYHDGYQWSDSIRDGIRSVLNESEYKIDLQVEYMDTKRFKYEEVTGMLLRLYKEKFARERFDVVLVSDNDAFTFASHYREELFPGVPLVFCGVNDLELPEIVQGNVTGVAENFDFMLTVDVALKLHPDKKRMVVVGDSSTAGLAIKRQIEAVVPAYKDRLAVEYWTNLSFSAVLQKVTKLPSDTFLFFIPYYLIIDGKSYTAEEVMEAIYGSSSVPIYTAWEFLLGHGAVGGRLLSGLQHGQNAAAITLRVLNGESADDIPIDREPSGQYEFDYNVMKRLRIDESLLPEGSLIVNAPKAFYELPKELFWTIIISFFIVLVIMCFLVLAMLERRKIERKIKDQLAFQETLMDTVPQLVSWKDVHGNYLGTNRAFAEFFGFPDSSAIVSNTPRKITSDLNYIEWAMEADKAVISSNDAFRKVRRELTDAHGNTVWVEVNKVAIHDQAGRIVGVLSTAENITKERNLEKQLLQSQKLEAIGTLAGGIAHDFNNILTSIINSTELAAGDVEPDSVTRKDLERVLKAARRGGRVVKQILAFSRPSTEGFRSTNVSAVVVEVLGLIEASMPSNIEVHSFVDPHLPCVLADPTQIHQVVMNLCTNAFHALRDTGGVIEAHLELARLGEEDARMIGLNPGEYVRVRIEDNGPGIPAEIVDKIFDPFFSTKDKTEGTGLGLAVVHGIVRSHKGGLQVFPRSGGGTVFEVYLPLSGEADSDETCVRHGLHGADAHILFVEDDEDQLHTTPRLLEIMGYRVTALRDPQEAARMLQDRSSHFDLLITDYDMPGMSGTQLAKLVKKTAPDLPVILVSGREDAATAASHLPNIHQVVIKPYDKNDLSAAISGVLDTE